jgi:probable rRNA maturation factor
MTIHLDVQVVSQETGIPDVADFERWANTVHTNNETNVCLRIVDELEAKALNNQFRHINNATNVLSFPAEIPSQVEMNFLGDIVICAPVVDDEAQQQGKQLNAHWAHLLVHGILHLQGYDHEDDQAANEMESLEIEILQKLNIPDPYQ